MISLDLGWSEAIESQAFDRVHRLGQQKDVFVHRLVIANTVEDRVLALQERKVEQVVLYIYTLLMHGFSETLRMAALVKAPEKRLAVSIHYEFSTQY